MRGVVSLCLQLLVMAGLLITCYGAPITCRAGTYAVGDSASVTCYFGTHISASGKSFNMARYSSPGDKAEIGTDVLVCHWAADQNKHDCTASYGYTFDGNITDHVTVGIPNVTENNEGMYKCFFMPGSPSQDSHACNFTVSVNTDEASDDNGRSAVNTDEASDDDRRSAESNKDTLIAIIVPVSIIVVVAVFILGIVCIRRRKKFKRGDSEEDPVEMQPLIKPKDKQITKRTKGLKLSTKQLREMMRTLEQEMDKGLNDSTRGEAEVKMYPVLPPPRDGAGSDDFLVIDVNSTCVTISCVGFRKTGLTVRKKSQSPFRPEMKTGPAKKIFDHIVSAIGLFVKDLRLSAKPLKAVLILHFPCHHTGLQEASLAKWTKEFNCDGVVDKDLNVLLKTAIKARKDLRVKIVAIVNNAVNTLLSAADHIPQCKIAMVVGDGFNVCFTDELKDENVTIVKDEVDTSAAVDEEHTNSANFEREADSPRREAESDNTKGERAKDNASNEQGKDSTALERQSHSSEKTHDTISNEGDKETDSAEDENETDWDVDEEDGNASSEDQETDTSTDDLETEKTKNKGQIGSSADQQKANSVDDGHGTSSDKEKDVTSDFKNGQEVPGEQGPCSAKDKEEAVSVEGSQEVSSVGEGIPEEVVYNTELGSLGERGSLESLRTVYDRQLDESSRIAGSQILEKMVSLTYLGELMRLVLNALITDQLLFHDPDTRDKDTLGADTHNADTLHQFKKGDFTPDSLVKVDKDTSDGSETAGILTDLGVPDRSDEDVRTVKYVCRLIIDRAAHLAGASLAAVINRLDQPDAVIATSGEMFRKIPRFSDVMYKTTRDLVKSKHNFYLVSSFTGGPVVAPRIAAAALPRT